MRNAHIDGWFYKATSVAQVASGLHWAETRLLRKHLSVQGLAQLVCLACSRGVKDTSTDRKNAELGKSSMCMRCSSWLLIIGDIQFLSHFMRRLVVDLNGARDLSDQGLRTVHTKVEPTLLI